VIAISITVPVVLVLIVFYVVMNPDKAEKIAGWVWRGITQLVGLGERKAVAFSVQGDVNSARADLAKNVPDGVMAASSKSSGRNPRKRTPR
jgi:hypothetical protein